MQTININQLQAKISAVIKEVEKGQQVQVMRYSKPVAVIVSYADFQYMQGNCARCIKQIREAIELIKSQKTNRSVKAK